jgi:cyclopropane fatty-acyl-phospholipid synthase-like methyltransferase
MEWLKLSWLLSRTPVSPASRLGFGILSGVIVAVTLAVATPGNFPLPAMAAIGVYQLFQRYGLPKAPKQDEYLVLKSARALRYKGRMIPSGLLVTMYMNDEIDFRGDVLECMSKGREFISWSLDWGQAWYNIKQLWPNDDNFMLRNRANSKKEIADHYDRGNDFFRAFLGPRMLYTSAIYHKTDETLEQAQDNKMRTIWGKLRTKPGDRVLDIGCGWGTTAAFAEREFQAKAVGVTLSDEGAAWSRKNNAGPEFLVCDYRDIPSGPEDQKFDAISCIEMAEHVGLVNFQKYLSKVSDLLSDEGGFLMQVAGLRQGCDMEDLAWGLFMSRYIFPGATASTPLHWYISQLELAGFEVESVENIGVHYSLTLNQWYKNFMRDHKALPKDKYPESIIRLWKIFLAWSTLASGRGTATCYQIVAHKGTRAFDKFDRKEMLKTVAGGVVGSAKAAEMWNNGPSPAGIAPTA